MTKSTYLLPCVIAAALPAFGADIVATNAYTWRGDTIIQGEYKAWAPSATEIISTYAASPGYFMPVSKRWRLRNDISAYPQLETANTLHTAIYNMGLDEMVNAIEPDTTLRTGKEWAGVWTRDISYSILLSMAYLQPEASRISLMKKVSPAGRIIQDTGSGGAWPISSDRMIWAIAAYEVYKVTGDRAWLEYIYPIIRDSFADDFLTTYGTASELVKGETSFIDWREQSYPKWMQTADIYQSEALNTSIVHAQALRTLAEISDELGHKAEAQRYRETADNIVTAVNDKLWMPDKGYYAMYTYGRNYPIINPRAELLGESLAVLYDIAPADRRASIVQNVPVTPFGAGIFFPQIADMPAYHNNSLWPWVGAYWAMANAKSGNEAGTIEAIGSVFRPAALFATNKENFVLDNGDIATELNSSNMLWCLAGNLAITHRILFGIDYRKDGLVFAPFVPEALSGERTLKNFRYRDAILDITVRGYGNRIKSFTLNGREHKPFIPADITGRNSIVITMADEHVAPMTVNRTTNIKAPLTPLTRLSHSAELAGEGIPANNLLQWHPIEYIHHYVVLRNGERIATTNATEYAATTPGEYQVIGVNVLPDGTAIESFASEPLNNFDLTVIEMPGEGTALKSPEVSYHPSQPVSNYHGNGFIEVDHHTAPVVVSDVAIPADGTYAVSVVYANGNGPVNTENKAAIRTLTVDGNRAGILVMPHRGVANWNDWGRSNGVKVSLAKGRHTLGIEYRPENENMNLGTNHAAIDRIIIEKID